MFESDADAASRAKDLFFAMLSHELRTPLSTMQLSADILREICRGDPRAVRALEAIHRAIASQTRLIEDMLDLSRIVSGKLRLDLCWVDLVDVIERSVDVVTASANDKGVLITSSLATFSSVLRGDPIRLEQVVGNLVANAIKWTPPGGRVDLELSPAGEGACLLVTDTGAGIAPDLLPHLFDRFVQGPNVTPSGSGLGLGLAIARQIVVAHGGEIRAESPGEGRGATFQVTFPTTVSTASIAEPSSAKAPSLRGIRVLLVDDDDDLRELCTTVLSDLGADVRVASSSSNGLAMLRETVVHAVLCDLAMIDEDGYTFIRRLRRMSNESGGRTPAAAFTASAGDADRKRALEAGFQMHLAKPLDGTRLALAILELAAREAD